MNNNEQDINLDALYEQRKAEMDVPNIDGIIAKSIEVSDEKNKMVQQSQKSSLLATLKKYLAISLTASVASFTVFAIINHLANPVSSQTKNETAVNQVKVTNNSSRSANNGDKQELSALQPTTKKVDTTLLTPETLTANKQEVIISEEMVIEIPENSNEVIILPSLQFTPETLLVVKKVVPKYPHAALKEKISGMVKLSYQIDAAGKVHNIEVMSSEQKLLTKAAIKALKQWRFKIDSNTNISKSFNIEFEFKLL